MRDLGFHTETRYQEATKQALRYATARDTSPTVPGDYVSEMARQAVFEIRRRYLTGGYASRTIRKSDQIGLCGIAQSVMSTIGVTDKGPEGYADPASRRK
jgi:membrane carboxypeptidase/penicillin-binding protein